MNRTKIEISFATMHHDRQGHGKYLYTYTYATQAVRGLKSSPSTTSSLLSSTGL